MVAGSAIETTVGRLSVDVLGTGRPAIIWPSLFVDETSWSRVLPSLTDDRRVVLIHGPGHGGSGDPGRRYDLSECAQAAGQILDDLAIGGTVDWVGNAWGGHVGLRFAVDQADRCRSLIMVGTPVAALSRAERVQTRILLAVYSMVGPVAPVVNGVTDALLSPHTRTHDPDAIKLVRDSLRHANRRMLRNAVDSISLHREDLTHLLPKVTVPMLLITGSDHLGFTPAQAEAAARLAPLGRSAEVPDAAYLVPLEAPTITSGLIREFWEEAADEDFSR